MHLRMHDTHACIQQCVAQKNVLLMWNYNKPIVAIENHYNLSCGNKVKSLTQNVFCSIMIKVSIFWEVVDLGTHATLYPYRHKDNPFIILLQYLLYNT